MAHVRHAASTWPLAAVCSIVRSICEDARLRGDHTCAFSRRHLPGVVPTRAENVRLKAAWSEKPTWRAISDSDLFDCNKRSFALSRRCDMRYRWTGAPKDILNDRAKWLADNPHALARVDSLNSPSSCSCSNSVTRRVCHGARPPW